MFSLELTSNDKEATENKISLYAQKTYLSENSNRVNRVF